MEDERFDVGIGSNPIEFCSASSSQEGWVFVVAGMIKGKPQTNPQERKQKKLTFGRAGPSTRMFNTLSASPSVTTLSFVSTSTWSSCWRPPNSGSEVCFKFGAVAIVLRRRADLFHGRGLEFGFGTAGKLKNIVPEYVVRYN